ncbi:MAG TPA: SufD family Fe-S cluster assembly protein, partial [Myxococcota bacterium]|nr:SufD family Fe-S cluster assembly protein [Myxococcota bacterium]
VVRPEAQKTEAFQRNHNLLLSKKAAAFTKPALEIFADDVKASHGATVGRLNEQDLFYLKSRGVPHNEARRLLVRGFAEEIFQQIPLAEGRSLAASFFEA